MLPSCSSSIFTAASRGWLRVIQCPSLSTTPSLLLDDEKTPGGEYNKHVGISSKKFNQRPRMRKRVAHTYMKPEGVNVDSPWPSVWQGPRAFDPYIVPFPLHMGFPLKGGESPPPLGNLELMKIPNFLHLTPPAIHSHCEALKPLCTPWPENLPALPLQIETRNYVFPSHSVKHPGSKQVVIIFKVADLHLSERAQKKMIELAGSRYKADKGTIRLYAGRCPTRAQNYDYALYLLKVLYLESNRLEMWELELSEDDEDSI